MTARASALQGVSAMLGLRRYEEAIAALAPVLAADPDNPRALCMLAQAQSGAGQHQEAVASASRAITLAPADGWAYRLVSVAQLRQGNAAAAVSAARQACRYAPHGWQSHVCLAQAAVAAKDDLAAAATAAQTARRLAPNEPDAHYVSGLVAFAQGDRGAARAHQERALALDPAHGGALNELGRIGLKSGRTAAAARHFLMAARSAPRVQAYSRNVEAVVRRTVAFVIYSAALATIAAILLAIAVHPERASVVAGLATIAVINAALGALRYWRMPAPARPLFRRRRIVAALAVTYGAIVLAVLIAAEDPAQTLPSDLLAAGFFIVAARYASFALLRREARARSASPGPTAGSSRSRWRRRPPAA